MNITQSLQKWGNGAGVRLPKKVIEAARLKLNQPLAVSLQGKAILLTPVDAHDGTDLKSLLDGVTPALVGGELEWGLDIGAEKYE